MFNIGQSFKSKIASLPLSPGVYRFLSKEGGVLYIGKAKNLKARVKQYFAGEDERPQIPYLMKEAADFDYTVVNNELESLYLERTLIKNHKPKYNIDLRDDKNYAFIKIDYSTEIPQLITVRKITNDKSDYFGPYTAAYKIRETLNTVRKIFTFCTNEKAGLKPCFYYHLHRCPGVCVGEMGLADYQKHIEKIRLFLSGKIAPAKKAITADMKKAVAGKKFEKAARLRDQLRAIEMLETKQNMIMPKPVSWDIVGIAFDEGMACVNLFKIREGKMLDKENFIYSNPDLQMRVGLMDSQGYILQNFLEDYYTETSDAPKEIFLPIEARNGDLIKKLITDRFKKSVKITVPKKNKALNLIRLSETNAREHLKNYLNAKAGHLDKIQRGLSQLKEILGLEEIPRRIECYDISNTQGTNPVGSMVVIENGLPKKSEYRKFKIQGKSTPDDFEMMKEMLSRRLNRIMNHKLRIMDKDKWPMPDLIVIDGGKGQLGVASSIIHNSKFIIPVIGLAKRIEEVFLPGQSAPIILPHDQPGLQLLQRLRDEAHRFGITFHRQLRSKQAIKSALDDVPGIGPKTKKLLKTKFGTIGNIRQASLVELTEVVGEKLAKQIKNEL